MNEALIRQIAENLVADDGSLADHIDTVRLIQAVRLARNVVRTGAMSEQANRGYDLACLLIQIIEDAVEWDKADERAIRKLEADEAKMRRSERMYD